MGYWDGDDYDDYGGGSFSDDDFGSDSFTVRYDFANGAPFGTFDLNGDGKLDFLEKSMKFDHYQSLWDEEDKASSYTYDDILLDEEDEDEMDDDDYVYSNFYSSPGYIASKNDFQNRRYYSEPLYEESSNKEFPKNNDEILEYDKEKEIISKDEMNEIEEEIVLQNEIEKETVKREHKTKEEIEHEEEQLKLLAGTRSSAALPCFLSWNQAETVRQRSILLTPQPVRHRKNLPVYNRKGRYILPVQCIRPAERVLHKSAGHCARWWQVRMPPAEVRILLILQ